MNARSYHHQHPETGNRFIICLPAHHGKKKKKTNGKCVPETTKGSIPREKKDKFFFALCSAMLCYYNKGRKRRTWEPSHGG